MRTVSSSNLQSYALETVDNCISRLKTSSLGLENETAATLLALYGPNEIDIEKAPKWFVQLFKAFLTPFNGVLFLVAMVSFFTDVWLVSKQEREFKTMSMVLVMVLMSSLIRFWQEYRSNVAATKLKKMISTTATVLRKGDGTKEIDIKNLVPGDIVFLSAERHDSCRLQSDTVKRFIHQSINAVRRGIAGREKRICFELYGTSIYS